MKAFFAIHLVMGLQPVPSMWDCWSSDPILQVPYIANIMPLKRFEELWAYVHFNDNEKMTSRDDENHDRAFKVRLVMDHLNKRFLKSLSPTKRQAIDEYMIKYQGHSMLKQYVKGKPIKRGFKLWCRCDSKSGFLYEFDLYTGKKMASLNMDWERVLYSCLLKRSLTAAVMFCWQFFQFTTAANFLNYVQHIFPKGAQNFLGVPCPCASWLRACSTANVHLLKRRYSVHSFVYKLYFCYCIGCIRSGKNFEIT